MPSAGDHRGKAALTLALTTVMGLSGVGIVLLGSLAPPASGSPLPPGDDCCGGGGKGHAGPGGAAGGGSAQPVGGDAGKEAAAPREAEAKGLLVDLGNVKCPIMGGKPDGKTFSEWNGLRIGHCCPGCAGRFQKDPLGSLDRAETDWLDLSETRQTEADEEGTEAGREETGWKAAAAAVRSVNDAETPVEREQALKALRAKWKVVRDPATAAKPGILVDLGNKSCPATGDEVDGETWSEWNGLRVGFCCAGCVEKFRKEPAAMLDRAGVEWKDAAADAKKVNEARTPEERGAALKELKAKWKVARDPVADDEPRKDPPRDGRDEGKDGGGHGRHHGD